MKEFIHNPGGRLIAGDDLEAIQNIALLQEQFLAQFGSFIISGCVLQGSNITAGVVILDGKACLFDGVQNTAVPFYVKQAVETEQVPYELGAGTGVGYTIYRAVAAISGEAGAFRLDDAPRFMDLLSRRFAAIVQGDTTKLIVSDGSRKAIADFATKEQGEKAGTALQPSRIFIGSAPSNPQDGDILIVP